MTDFQAEAIPPEEGAQIEEIARLTVAMMKDRYPDGRILRGVHPKSHGCVRCEFRVAEDIDPKFRIGLFEEPGRAFEAWMRYSNATPTVGPDVGADGSAASRGCALKIRNVNGKKLMRGAPKHQDFLMINLPAFAFKDVEQYLALTEVQARNGDLMQFLSQHPRSLQIVGKVFATQVGNPLDATYFTAAPFALGSEMAVKYAIAPRVQQGDRVPDAPSPNYLNEALARTLDPRTGKAVEFDFRVQVRTALDQPIEDATAEWPEADAPFVNIATVTVQPQDVNAPKRVKKCERLVFTPWHGLVENRPLGGINRLRKAVYIASSELRERKKKKK